MNFITKWVSIMLNKTNNVGNRYALKSKRTHNFRLSMYESIYPTHCIIICLFCKHYLVDVACVYFMFP